MTRVTRVLESDIQTEIRLAASQYPDLVLWRNSTGVTQDIDRKRRYGLCVGSSDLIGILSIERSSRVIGRFVALEVKRPDGVVSEDQKLFLALIRQHGGFACVVRSVTDFHDAMRRAVTGACE